jgi:hypothetical protein
VFDDFLRKRAGKLGANLINGLYMGMEQQGPDGPITLRYNAYKEGEQRPVCLFVAQLWVESPVTVCGISLKALLSSLYGLHGSHRPAVTRA